MGLLATLAPGLDVSATVVGAGDLATASLAGSAVANAILWRAVAVAFINLVLNEGLARWQLATDQSVLEGSVYHFGRYVQWFFVVYLLAWSLGVGAALISACGVTGHALIPVFRDAQFGKIFWGVAHSAATVALVLVGGFKRFEKVMTVLLVVMFGSVLAAAVMSKPDWGAVVRGLLVPRIPTNVNPDAAKWTLALMGGVGGTVTMLCYGYWIREQGRVGPAFLGTCRFDLLVSYAVIAIFGVSMVLIGRGLHLTEEGATGMMIKLADRLGEALGRPMRWAFLAGAWAAVFTSMLGVWQAVPYLFADFWRLFTRAPAGTEVDRRSPIYRAYLIALATVPMLGLWQNFVYVQRSYSLLGAVVMPLLALALLILNGRGDLVGERFKNRPLTVVVLIAVLLFFAYAGYVTIVTLGKENILS